MDALLFHGSTLSKSQHRGVLADVVGAMFLLACVVSLSARAAGAESKVVPSATPTSGIEIQYIDHDVRPQDDFYRFVNGKWLDTIEIPADKERVSPSALVDDAIRERLRLIIEEAQRTPSSDGDARKIADLYASFMDESALERLGLKPLDAELALIDSISDKRDLAREMGHLDQVWVPVPVSMWLLTDQKDAKHYAAYAHPSGLGMPSREYYIANDAKLVQARTAYVLHVQKVLGLSGDKDAERHSKEILALETRLATAQWDIADAFDPVKTYNRTDIEALATTAPGYDWKDFFEATGASPRTGWLVVTQPSYMKTLGEIVSQTPLPVWKAYLRWQMLSTYAPYLNRAFVDEEFAFDSTTLRGTTQDKPRWKRGVDVVEEAMGEALGRLYVERYFPPASKARVDTMVKNIVAAFRQDTDTLDWMTPQAKREAKAKLDKLHVKIGYPDHWLDYSALRVDKDDPVGNVMRGRSTSYVRNVAKLGSAVDAGEWDLTPQTVDASSDPSLNEITFPAGLMNPPFFDARADDASNYGAIGGTIGHEISHLFDNGGSQYDADGTLLGKPGWFTQGDQEHFNARTHALVEQYSAFEPLPGFHVNGEQTLPENIADNSGIAIAYKAYHLSLHGKSAPVIDGMTGDQRFFMAWTQKWRAKVRDAETIRLLKSDEHSPRFVRGIAPVRNQAAFYSAFDIKPGDKMYLPPEQRVTIW